MRHTKICRVCGKEYTPCNGSVFNAPSDMTWQIVACSKECGAEYFARIAASQKAAESVSAEPVEEVATPVVAEAKESESADSIIKSSRRSKKVKSILDELE